MIEIHSLTKRYDDFTAVDSVDLTIPEGEVTAIVGTNGAGKSTLMRMLSGIVRPSKGLITLNGESVYEAPGVKQRFFYISDDQYIPGAYRVSDLCSFYSGFYPFFDRIKAEELIDIFSLPKQRKTGSFSKGMKKLLFIALALSAGTEYILADETFDGIDPLMRVRVKELLRAEMSSRPLTPVISSHHFDELSDLIADAALMHKGRIVYKGPAGGIYEQDIFGLD